MDYAPSQFTGSHMDTVLGIKSCRLGDLNSTHLFFIVLEAKRSKIKLSADSVPDKSSPSVL